MSTAAVSFHNVATIKTTDDTMTTESGRTFTRRELMVTDSEGQTLRIDLFLTPDFERESK